MKFRKKPVVIDAVQWTGNNAQEIYDFCGSGNRDCHVCGNEMLIQTLEGTMTASAGDYIIRGVNGEHYPCKPDIFDKTYEPV
ncbi:TPA: hypothetical protein I8627_002156 [Citrobacter freundii]|uniref:hypothetical protein n=1 Tax=Citrobacter braakii TaxID=57706 RepID=UPI001A205BE5|nr:hypothetical protein [Citrobacter braakii]EKX5047019.1 hypothetical protein [Citrobacter freundii]MDW2592612.1 hypothetical protein [Citrobacter braakii]MDW2656525.1 hypothetical protein [Citrobacter braakii]MDW2704240.1 hypothetical protein [Citrobacter braakii]HAT3769311.1 hypothetical protein [Citrobacter freundii]